MKEVVINECHGGFGLSYEATMEYAKLSGFELYPHIDESTRRIYGENAYLKNPQILIHYTKVPWEEWEVVKNKDKKSSLYFSSRDIDRKDPLLLKLIKQKGSKWVSGFFARLKIVKIPDDVDYIIEEYDGSEWIAETHRTWR
jgi:hypothetical protein